MLIYRAPIMKWGVVLAGASDFLRPAEKLSLTQNLALMATGSIWTRWCFVIIPKNMLYVASLPSDTLVTASIKHSDYYSRTTVWLQSTSVSSV